MSSSSFCIIVFTSDRLKGCDRHQSNFRPKKFEIIECEKDCKGYKGCKGCKDCEGYAKIAKVEKVPKVVMLSRSGRLCWQQRKQMLQWQQRRFAIVTLVMRNIFSNITLNTLKQWFSTLELWWPTKDYNQILAPKQAHFLLFIISFSAFIETKLTYFVAFMIL